MSTDCIFCKIIHQELPAKRVYEDEQILAIHDRFPKAPTHVLVLPKQHFSGLSALTHNEQPLMWHLLQKLHPIAIQLGLEEGFRTVINTGSGGGQTIFHFHAHIMGGKGLPAL